MTAYGTTVVEEDVIANKYFSLGIPPWCVNTQHWYNKEFKTPDDESLAKRINEQNVEKDTSGAAMKNEEDN